MDNEEEEDVDEETAATPKRSAFFYMHNSQLASFVSPTTSSETS